VTDEDAALEHVEDLPTPTAKPTWVEGLRHILADVLEPERLRLAEAGDAEALAYGYHDLQPLVAEFNVFLRDLQFDVAKIMDERNVGKLPVEGVGVVESHRTIERRDWQSSALLQRIVLHALAEAGVLDPETGQIGNEEAFQAANLITTFLSTALPLTGSLQWRVGQWDKSKGTYASGIRSLGLDPDDWCRETYGPPRAQIPKRPMTERKST
jgi:hypothetical protein